MYLQKQDILWMVTSLRRENPLWTAKHLQTGTLWTGNFLSQTKLPWMRNFPVLPKRLWKETFWKEHPLPEKTWRWKQKPEMTAEWNCSRKIQGSLPSKVMGMRLPAQANLPRNAPLRPELELKAAQGKMPLKVQPLPEGGKQGHPLLRQSRKHLPLQGKPPLPASLP